MTSEKFDFQHLVRQIKDIHENLLRQAAKAVNMGLTFRNWLIGMHIAEYELRGTDRNVYGERLISDLSKQLTDLKVSNCNRRQLYHYLAFYRTYPQIVGSLSPQLQSFISVNLDMEQNVGTAPPQTLYQS